MVDRSGGMWLRPSLWLVVVVLLATRSGCAATEDGFVGRQQDGDVFYGEYTVHFIK